MNDIDRFTGKWEVMTVPVSVSETNPAHTVSPRTSEFICNGVPTSTGGWRNPVALTGAGTGNVNALPAHPIGDPDKTAGGVSGAPNTLRGYGINGDRMNRTVLVGYMTDRWYEGAILKKDLYTP